MYLKMFIKIKRRKNKLVVANLLVTPKHHENCLLASPEFSISVVQNETNQFLMERREEKNDIICNCSLSHKTQLFPLKTS